MTLLSGAFGVICLSLYFVRPGMLNLLLGQQFHVFILVNGIALVLVAAIRAGMLWSTSGAKAIGRVHEHDEVGESQPHSHSHCQDACNHAREDHDHACAPWRYIVLLVPIIFFLLGLPDRGPSINAQDLTKLEDSASAHEETVGYVAAAALNSASLAPISAALAAWNEIDSNLNAAPLVGVKYLDSLAGNASDRQYWKGKAIRFRGQFIGHSDHYFDVARFLVKCCGADAILKHIPVLAKENVPQFKRESWVEVGGRIDFRSNSTGSYATVVIVSRRGHIRACNPDLNPYEQ
jgi:hypothetical protein